METPETIVNDAWRSTLIGIYMTAVDDRLHYSAGNAYAKLYEGECGDTLRSIMLFGHLDDAPAMLKPLLEFDRQDTRFHVAGHKLQLLAYFYWLTRDAEDGPRLRAAVAAVGRPHSQQPRTRDRAVAERQLRRRHRRASLLAQFERQLLARPSRCGRHARRHGSKRRSRKASQRGRRVSRGDSRRRRPQRAARHQAAVHPHRDFWPTNRPTTRSPPRDRAATTISCARTSSAPRFSARAPTAKIGCSATWRTTAASPWA